MAILMAYTIVLLGEPREPGEKHGKNTLSWDDGVPLVNDHFMGGPYHKTRQSLSKSTEQWFLQPLTKRGSLCFWLGSKDLSLNHDF